MGQSSILSLPAGAPLTVSNAYTSHPIQFMQRCLRAEKDTLTQQDSINSFDLDEGQITPVARSTQFFIGKLRGRQDVLFEKKLQRSLLFIYEVSGTCEVHNRLLLPGDGLSLTNSRSIEFEALTPEAIVFVAEIPLDKVN